MDVSSYLRRWVVSGPPGRQRRWSRVIRAVLLLLLSQACTSHAKDNSSCPLHPLASIDLAVDGPVLVPVTLQGQPAWMVLQTEASVTVIYSDAAEALHLPTQNIEKEYFQLSLGGRRVTQLASLKPLTIGDLSVSRSRFMVDPFPHGSQVYAGRRVAGALAMDLLWPYDLDLDLAHKKLVLYAAGSCAGQAVYRTGRYRQMPMNFTAIGNVYFTAEIDGMKLEASIATSSNSSAMSIDVARRLMGPAQQDATLVAVGSSLPPGSLTKVIRFASGQLVIPQTIQLVAETPGCVLGTAGNPDGALGYSGCYGRYPLVLGRDALRKLHLYFASKERLIYFSPVDVQ
jgi:hypothetical protein